MNLNNTKKRMNQNFDTPFYTSTANNFFPKIGSCQMEFYNNMLTEPFILRPSYQHCPMSPISGFEFCAREKQEKAAKY